MTATSRNDLATPANIITIVRICLVPVYVIMLLCPWIEWLGIKGIDPTDGRIFAAIAFIIIACTDFIDGYLARSRNEVTDFGKFADPLADKILVAAALISLVELDTLPAWVALVILAREFIISGVRMIAAARGEVIAASYLGKFKTASQMTGIVLFTIQGSHLVASFGPDFEHGLFIFGWVIMGIAVVLTIWSLVDYLYKARHLFRSSPETDDDISQDKLAADCHALAEKIISRASATSTTIATAESLTGGLISGKLTAVSGSSAVVRGGVTSYATEIKHSVLGVSDERLAETGPVDGEVAKQMADGARQLLGADIAVAVTGIAGPTGAEPDKPVGTVWIALSRDGARDSFLYVFEGDREQVRLQTVREALSLIDATLEGDK